MKRGIFFFGLSLSAHTDAGQPQKNRDGRAVARPPRPSSSSSTSRQSSRSRSDETWAARRARAVAELRREWEHRQQRGHDMVDKVSRVHAGRGADDDGRWGDDARPSSRSFPSQPQRKKSSSPLSSSSHRDWDWGRATKGAHRGRGLHHDGNRRASTTTPPPRSPPPAPPRSASCEHHRHHHTGSTERRQHPDLGLLEGPVEPLAQHPQARPTHPARGRQHSQNSLSAILTSRAPTHTPSDAGRHLLAAESQSDVMHGPQPRTRPPVGPQQSAMSPVLQSWDPGEWRTSHRQHHPPVPLAPLAQTLSNALATAPLTAHVSLGCIGSTPFCGELFSR